MYSTLTPLASQNHIFLSATSSRQQDAVPRGSSPGADRGDVAAGGRGADAAPDGAHRPPVRGSGRRLRSAVRPRAAAPELRVQGGAPAAAPGQDEEHAGGRLHRQARRRPGRPLKKEGGKRQRDEKKMKRTKEVKKPLIACFSAERHQTALSLDISTWHMHAFLNRFFFFFSPCTQGATGHLARRAEPPIDAPGWAGFGWRTGRMLKDCCSRMDVLSA